jgi:hypothetical protein
MFIKSKKRNVYFLIKGFIKIVDAITPLMSFGFYWTDLEYKFTKWYIFKNDKKKVTKLK